MTTSRYHAFDEASAKVFTLQGSSSTVVFVEQAYGVKLIYFGSTLPFSPTADAIHALSKRQEAPASPSEDVELTTLPFHGAGYTGASAFKCRNAGDAWAFLPDVVKITQPSESALQISLQDSAREISITQEVSLDANSDMLTFCSSVENTGSNTLHVDYLAAATLPVSHSFTEVMGFEGHWSREFQPHRHPLNAGGYVRENRRGRTSHDAFPGVILLSSTTSEVTGSALGCHLGWSGNHKTQVDVMSDGRAALSMGELLLPGEVTLAKGERYETPVMYCAQTQSGLNDLSASFHAYVRNNLAPRAMKPRPVHYNTWEGLYFDHDMDTLLDLVKRASNLGVERFVLDDGWFKGRDNDTSSLGDWYVDERKYPNGLQPLAKAVVDAGMEFGLWVEPEMVNPDSDLYRRHPDWVLNAGDNPQLGFRHQLVLDLTNPEVFAFLHERLDHFLSTLPVSYVKWDMNRELNHPGSQSKPAVHKQTLALYALLDKLREAHPEVEIESCSSGGGRADFGVLSRTDRVWTSDNNDALMRLKIQRGFSYFLPPHIMGSHVGPRDCHITHRHLSMDFRAATALFGHMGMEMDLRELTDEEVVKLKQALEIYKANRALIHSGKWTRLATQPYQMATAIISEDQSNALVHYALMDDHNTSLPSPLKINGLDPAATYKLSMLLPSKNDLVEHSLFHISPLLLNALDKEYPGFLLESMGIEVPLMTPESALVLSLERVG